MIQEFINKYITNKDKLRAQFAEKHPDSYQDLVTMVVAILNDEDSSYGAPSPERITEIDDGDYQGTLLYVISASGYQPSDYWYVKVNYGSCSGCDTLEGIRNYSDEKPTEEQINDYMTLCLHIVEGLKSMQQE